MWLKLLEDFGADGVRYGLMSSAAAGGDILFDDKLCENGRNFCNKLWNALRLVKGWQVAPPSPPDGGDNNTDSPPSGGLGGAKNALAIRWLNEKFKSVLAEIESNFQQFRLSEALLALYGFIWDDFCSWYLEMIKPGYEQPIDRATYEATLDIFSEMMVALHPFMPFITEELWHQLRDRAEGDDCMKQRYPVQAKADNALIQKVESAKDVIGKIRDLRNQNQLKPRDPLVVQVQASASAQALFAQEGLREMVIKLAVLSEFDATETEPDNAKSFISGTDKYYVVLSQKVDVAAECAKIKQELEHQRGFVKMVEAKLSNERFVSSAPAQVVENERKKMADGVARISILEESAAKLGCE